jgi:predicted metal-dependent hydrolase
MGDSGIIYVYIIAIILLLLYIYYDNFHTSLVKEKSDIDGKTYLVRNMKDKKQAANLIARVKLKLVKLSNYLEKKYPNDARVEMMVVNFKPDKIMESTPNSKYTSYSVNKGEKVVLCLRSRNSKEELVDENVLMFVALHEFAHICTKSIGHTDDFWDNFKWLLQQSVKIGIYKKHDFTKKPEPYCGTTITDSPLK